MSDKSQILCKYHMSGICRYGAHCAFSHNFSDMPNQVCKFYLAGHCAYGDRCRYYHKRPEYWKANRDTGSGAGGQSQQQQQQRPQAAATGGRGGGSSGAVRGGRYTWTRDAPGPHDTSRLPRSLGGGGGGAVPSYGATRGGGDSGSRRGIAGRGQQAAGPWAGQPGGGAGGGGVYGEVYHGAYDEYNEEYYDEDDEEFFDEYRPDEQQTQQVVGAGNGGGHGGVGLDGAEQGNEPVAAEEAEAEGAEEAEAEGAEEAEAEGAEEEEAEEAEEQEAETEAEEEAEGKAPVVATSSSVGAEEAVEDVGLVIVDDDVGLVAEARTVARRARAEPPTDGAGAAASAWAGQPHPWEQGGSGDGTLAAAAAAAAAAMDPVDPADVELCLDFALHGRCAEGEECPLIHGLECESCRKFRIHPYNPEAAAEHRETCRLRHERLEARLRSADVECGICLEPVLSKSSVQDRRFGLMACDHPFCLPCIRSWRERTDDTTLATDTAVRTCPICRTSTHFVTPSLVWPATAEEKADVVATYRAKLASIDCRHFDFGEGTCPFSTSCFYRHMYRDGRMEEPVLRRAGDADGGVRVVMPVRLSAFFDTPHAQRLLNRR